MEYGSWSGNRRKVNITIGCTATDFSLLSCSKPACEPGVISLRMHGVSMIVTKLFDPGDGVTYSLIFSKEDANTILSADKGELINLPSISGNLFIRDNEAAFMYKNGAFGMGSIFTDYRELCSQIKSTLESADEEDGYE